MDHIIETNKKLTKRWETDVMMTRSHNTPLLQHLSFPARRESVLSDTDVWAFDTLSQHGCMCDSQGFFLAHQRMTVAEFFTNP